MKTKNLVIAALLCAIGIVIPMFAPKIVLEPASFTLASHVPVFIAMFISPLTAVIVSVGTTVGFLFSGLPIVVVLRAMSHLLFASVGAIWLEKGKMHKPTSLYLWGGAVSLIHGVGEFIVVSLFYMAGNVSASYYSNGFFTSVFLLVFFGTVIHSMVDFFIALVVGKALRIPSIRLATTAPQQ